MKTSDLIKILQESMEINGDLYVNVCTDGIVYGDVDINCVDETLYVEGYPMY